ncbi:MAG: TonB family protein [Nitrospirae bacterium]|nr:TonB family protein [Nitrospirota bacterium]
MNLRQSLILSSIFHVFLMFLFSISFLLVPNKTIEPGKSLIANLVTPEETKTIIPSSKDVDRPLLPSNSKPYTIKPDSLQPKIYVPVQPEIHSKPLENIKPPVTAQPLPESTEKINPRKESSTVVQTPVEKKTEQKTPIMQLIPAETNDNKFVKKQEEIHHIQPKKKEEQQKIESNIPIKPPASIKEKLFDKGILGDIAKRKDESNGKNKSENIPLKDLKKEQPFSLRETLKDARTFTPQKGLSFDVSDLKFLLYNLKLKERIEHIWIYPPGAALRGISGDLIIRFTIKKDGKLGSIELVRTSGYKDLDDAALKALRDASPFWPLPESWGMESYTINGHFVYTIIYNL